ncbi:MAG: DUF4345 family protein [Polyangiales bacterium]
MATLSIALVAACFLGMGVYGLVAPARLIAPFGVRLDSPEARSEVRAVYGGFGIAIALLLALALRESELRAGVLCSVAAALLGMASGRLVARGLGDKPARFYPGWFYFWLELFAAALLLAAR